MKLTLRVSGLICAAGLLSGTSLAWDPTAPVTLTITTTPVSAPKGYAIPIDFSGLSVETSTIMSGNNGISGNLFSPTMNTEVITLFQNLGIKNLRVGGGTVESSNYNPSDSDIDNLFQFAPLAGVKVIYSLRLLNGCASCDATTAGYIYTNNYQKSLYSFATGNEPDWHSYHTSQPCSGKSAQTVNPAIYEENYPSKSTPCVPGSAYPSYLSDWHTFAGGIVSSAHAATFSGPDTGSYDTGTYYNSESWTQAFANDEKSALNQDNLPLSTAALQHFYVGHSPSITVNNILYSLTTQQAIDNMLSKDWVVNTGVDLPEPHQPSGAQSNFLFTPYPWLYTNNLQPVVALGLPYRLTESNDFLTGVSGASNGYAAALWTLDYMQWWAAHNAAGVNFHNKQWIYTDTIVPNPNPCVGTCGNYQTTPKGYGMKAFDLGGHGYVEPIAISNPNNINLTAYAVGSAQDLYVTIINKTHLSTNDITDAVVTIQPSGLHAASCSSLVLTDGDPGNATSYTATLGGATIANNARWAGQWTPLSPDTGGSCSVTVPATTAAVVRIRGASAYAGPVQIDQNGALEVFGTATNSDTWHNWQIAADVPNSPLSNWNGWTDLRGGVLSKGGIAVVKNLNNTLEIFIPAHDGDVYSNYQLIPGGGWSGWSDMGSASNGITNLQAANNADGSLSVFGIGSNGDTWYASQSAPGLGWSAWTDLSGEQIQPGFAVGQNLDGLLEVFGVDSSGNVWCNSQTADGAWSSWNSLSGKSLNPRLAVARNLDGRLEIFGVDNSSNVWHNWQTSPGGAWNGWSEIAGKQLQPGFVVGQHKDGRLVLIGVASASPYDVWNIWQQWAAGDNFGGSWTDMGGAGMNPQLVVGSTADNRIQLFGVSTAPSYDVWSDWQPASGGWNGWSDFGGSGMKFYAGQP